MVENQYGICKGWRRIDMDVCKYLINILNMFMQFDNGQAMPAPAASDYHYIYDPLNGFSSRHAAVINQRHAQII